MSRTTYDSPTPTPPPLPPALLAQNLDTLPHITALLLRLQAHINTQPSNPASTPLPNTSSDALTKGTAPLSTKEFSLACDELRQRLRRARAAVKELDGVGMTIDEQEVELKSMENKIEEQRRALRDLKNRSGKVVERLRHVPNSEDHMDTS